MLSKRTFTPEQLRYLQLLAKQYPTVQSAGTEIIRLQSILNLPKGTEHFMSDIHGEYDAFLHILNSCSGEVKEKIAQGKIAAFYKDICLLQQEFVRADLFKGDVAGYIADAGKKLGGKVTFVNAIHYTKGEGIEKKVDDFAAEVAAQVAGAKK